MPVTLPDNTVPLVLVDWLDTTLLDTTALPTQQTATTMAALMPVTWLVSTVLPVDWQDTTLPAMVPQADSQDTQPTRRIATTTAVLMLVTWQVSKATHQVSVTQRLAASELLEVSVTPLVELATHLASATLPTPPTATMMDALMLVTWPATPLPAEDWQDTQPQATAHQGTLSPAPLLLLLLPAHWAETTLQAPTTPALPTSWTPMLAQAATATLAPLLAVDSQDMAPAADSATLPTQLIVITTAASTLATSQVNKATHQV
jgi:hypothetical protein